MDNINWIFTLSGWIFLWWEITNMPTQVIPEHLHQQHLPAADDCQGSHLGDILYYILYYCLISRIYGFPHRLLSTSTSQDKKSRLQNPHPHPSTPISNPTRSKAPKHPQPPLSQLYSAQSPTSFLLIDWSSTPPVHHQPHCACVYISTMPRSGE